MATNTLRSFFTLKQQYEAELFEAQLQYAVQYLGDNASEIAISKLIKLLDDGFKSIIKDVIISKKALDTQDAYNSQHHLIQMDFKCEDEYRHHLKVLEEFLDVIPAYRKIVKFE